MFETCKPDTRKSVGSSQSHHCLEEREVEWLTKIRQVVPHLWQSVITPHGLTDPVIVWLRRVWTDVKKSVLIVTVYPTPLHGNGQKRTTLQKIFIFLHGNWLCAAQCSLFSSRAERLAFPESDKAATSQFSCSVSHYCHWRQPLTLDWLKNIYFILFVYII